MTKETRYNLIFLIILLALIIPGGVILFNKKLRTKSPAGMFLPSYSQPQKQPVYINYDDPRQTEGQKRGAPSATAQWVQYLTSQLFDPQTRQHIHWFNGLASEHRRFEVPAIITSQASGTILVAVVWDPKITKPTFHLGDDPMAQVGQFTWDVPPMIRSELQYAGFTRPPEQVTAYMLQSSVAAPNQSLVIQSASTTKQPNSPLQDSLTIPAMSQAQFSGKLADPPAATIPTSPPSTAPAKP